MYPKLEAIEAKELYPLEVGLVSNSQSTSSNGTGYKAIPWMYFGASRFDTVKNSKAVAVNDVAVITLTPFSNISNVLPSHLNIILQVFVVVVYN